MAIINMAPASIFNCMWCQVEHVKFYYEEYGQGTPVVLIHGWGYDHRLIAGCMEPVFEKKAGYRRIYIDLPGMGKTRGSPELKDADGLLEAIMAFVDRVIPGQDFLVAGQSFGGYLARGMVYKMPERLDGALLICPVIIPARDERDLPPYRMMKEDKVLEAGLNPGELDDYRSPVIVQDGRTLERFRSDLLPGLRAYDPTFSDAFQDCCCGYSFDVDSPDKPFEKPSLILTARQDTQVGYRDALRIVDNYPRGTFAVVDEAGHGLPIERGGIFDALVNDWLDRVEARPGKSNNP